MATEDKDFQSGEKVFVTDTKDIRFLLNQKVEYRSKSVVFPDTHWIEGEINGKSQIQGLKSNQFIRKSMPQTRDEEG